MSNISRKGKIDLEVLHRMLRQGSSQAECARHFRCSRSAISQAAGQLRGGIIRTSVMENAARIVAVDIRVLEEMNRLHQRTNQLLERLSGQLDSDESKMKQGDIVTNIIKLLGETRQQIKLGSDIVESLNDFRQVQEFQKLVLDIILHEVNGDTRKRIIERLKENQVIRRSLVISQ